MQCGEFNNAGQCGAKWSSSEHWCLALNAWVNSSLLIWSRCSGRSDFKRKDWKIFLRLCYKGGRPGGSSPVWNPEPIFFSLDQNGPKMLSKIIALIKSKNTAKIRAIDTSWVQFWKNAFWLSCQLCLQLPQVECKLQRKCFDSLSHTLILCHCGRFLTWPFGLTIS